MLLRRHALLRGELRLGAHQGGAHAPHLIRVRVRLRVQAGVQVQAGVRVGVRVGAQVVGFRLGFRLGLGLGLARPTSRQCAACARSSSRPKSGAGRPREAAAQVCDACTRLGLGLGLGLGFANPHPNQGAGVRRLHECLGASQQRGWLRAAAAAGRVGRRHERAGGPVGGRGGLAQVAHRRW